MFWDLQHIPQSTKNHIMFHLSMTTSVKDQVFKKDKLYEVKMHDQWDVCIKTLISNRRGEYASKEFEEYLAQQGTRHRLTITTLREKIG